MNIKEWNNKYNVGDTYKGLTICCVHRTKYKIQVIMSDNSTDWIDLSHEVDEKGLWSHLDLMGENIEQS